MPAKPYRSRRIAGQQRRRATDATKIRRADGVEQTYHVARTDPSKVRFTDTSLAPVGMPQPIRLPQPLPPRPAAPRGAVAAGVLGALGAGLVVAVPYVGGMFANGSIVGGAIALLAMIGGTTVAVIRRRIDEQRAAELAAYDTYIDDHLHRTLLNDGFDLTRDQQRNLLRGAPVAVDPAGNPHEATHVVRTATGIAWERRRTDAAAAPAQAGT